MKLTKSEKETMYRIIAIFDECGEKSTFTEEEQKAIDSAHRKLRMEIYGF